VKQWSAALTISSKVHFSLEPSERGGQHTGSTVFHLKCNSPMMVWKVQVFLDGLTAVNKGLLWEGEQGWSCAAAQFRLELVNAYIIILFLLWFPPSSLGGCRAAAESTGMTKQGLSCYDSGNPQLRFNYWHQSLRDVWAKSLQFCCLIHSICSPLNPLLRPEQLQRMNQGVLHRNHRGDIKYSTYGSLLAKVLSSLISHYAQQ